MLSSLLLGLRTSTSRSSLERRNVCFVLLLLRVARLRYTNRFVARDYLSIWVIWSLPLSLCLCNVVIGINSIPRWRFSRVQRTKIFLNNHPTVRTFISTMGSSSRLSVLRYRFQWRLISCGPRHLERSEERFNSNWWLFFFFLLAKRKFNVGRAKNEVCQIMLH